MGKTELITIAINFIFTIAVLVCIPMWFKDGDYILLAFIAYLALFQFITVGFLLKKIGGDDNGNN